MNTIEKYAYNYLKDKFPLAEIEYRFRDTPDFVIKNKADISFYEVKSLSKSNRIIFYDDQIERLKKHLETYLLLYRKESKKPIVTHFNKDNWRGKYGYRQIDNQHPYGKKERMVSLNLQLYERYKDFHLLNDKDMAERMGFSRAYMSRIAGGSRAPSSFFIEKYLKVTGLSFERAFKCNGDHSFQKDNFKKEKGEMPYVEWSERGPKRTFLQTVTTTKDLTRNKT